MEGHLSWKGFPSAHDFKNQGKQKELLLKEVEELQEQVHQLQLEKALLEGAAELLKKEKASIYFVYQIKKRLY